jgi:hypothetical protein
MTMHAGVGEYEAVERPNVVYLIKAKRRGNLDSPASGFDVYEVHPGQRMTNHPTLTYCVGEDDNVTFEVDPVDMGLPPEGTAGIDHLLPWQTFSRRSERLTDLRVLP